MSEDGGPRGEAAPAPDRLRRDDSETSDDRAGSLSSPASGPPASVREAMQRSRKYNPAPARRSPGRRRKPAPSRSASPPPARELTHGPVPETPSREVEVGNEVWNILLKGSSRVGFSRKHGVRLLSVGLEAPGDRPNPEGTHYLVAQRLDAVDEDVLRGLVARAAHRPGGQSPQSSRPAARTRRRGRSRRSDR